MGLISGRGRGGGEERGGTVSEALVKLAEHKTERRCLAKRWRRRDATFPSTIH